jgi:hypothetical protein
MHAPAEDKSDSFYEKVQHVFDHFPKYHMKLLLGVFNAKAGRENTFKLTIKNESLQGLSNYNGVRIVNCAILKNLIVESTFCNIHKYTLTFPAVKTHNQTSCIER